MISILLMAVHHRSTGVLDVVTTRTFQEFPGLLRAYKLATRSGETIVPCIIWGCLLGCGYNLWLQFCALGLVMGGESPHIGKVS
jgi:hypothetical protein